MKSGVQPVRKDHRTYSFKRTFGAPALALPSEYNVDSGFGFPDQNADGAPEGCTSYAQTEMAQTEDGTRYKPSYTYYWTRFLEGTLGQNVGCNIYDSLKSAIVYGLQTPDETTVAEAQLHRRGQYFSVVDNFNSSDAFDDVRTAMFLTRKRSVSAATPWFLDFANQSDGILPQPSNWDLKYASWHNWLIVGWKTINDQPYLIGKSWQGPNYGDHGYHYVSRELFNQLMAQNGSGAFTFAIARPEDILRIKLTTYQWILSYCMMLLTKIV